MLEFGTKTIINITKSMQFGILVPEIIELL